MSEVKLVARTMALFELYAARGEPLTLTELSQGLQVPMSSTLALVRTLVGRGYLYQTRKRSYYPTKKLTGLCQSIDERDPVLDLIRPYLERLRDESGETAVLGTQEGLRLLYLDAAHSPHSIRYTAKAGETRSLHSNSLGKALMSVMDARELEDLLPQIELIPLTDQTLTTRAALLADMAESKKRGWASNIAESVEDLAAVAAAFNLGGKWYALSIVGPMSRMQPAWDDHVSTLKSVIAEVNEDQDAE